MLRHSGSRKKKIRNCCCQVEQGSAVQSAHYGGSRFQCVQILVHCGIWNEKKQIRLGRIFILAKHHQHFISKIRVYLNLVVDFGHIVQKAIGSMGIMARIWKKRILSMKKYYCVIIFQKIFGRSSSSGSCTEIVNESYCVIFKRNRSSSRSH
ncbi:hypothetical protein PGUG_02001 [Meyerozyma guilliermondii ATCC 6260]|uniref:Uncharacterized protein n=1 Tax=Meyerozyma guilliermondii (strain ATCC 6260 / CBS 566 / DSM 6381 / JCM 1539 / NBRC 10279 / NRRL Y-324) TaxID=294746 RepID=A5DFF0_PICGU|nr:uncharacterized protein PGUG_02001 [Meyerozyma guilliermondii ATCC 6260]EDK37902.2 hypothetical protein PGUG_02001 [Meyerozyma guilliermondii ATCC 6260]